MPRYKTIGSLIFIAMDLFALDIDEAINIALKNNYSLRERQYRVEEARAESEASKSAYLPKVNIGYTYNNRDKLIIMQTDEDSTLNADLSYNLFNGLRDRYAIQGDESLFDASRSTLHAKRYDLILDVKSSYIDYLLKEKQTQTEGEALKLYKKQYFDSTNYLEQGLIAQDELLEVEVVMLQAEQNYQIAKGAQKIAKKELRNILSGHLNIDENIEELNKDRQTLIKFDERSLENRSEIKALKSKVQDYDSRVKAAKGTFLPTVDVILSYNRYGDKVFPDGRENYPRDQMLGTVDLKWNLYNGKKDEATIVRYRAKANQIKMQLEDLRLKIRLQYERAQEGYDVTISNLVTATKAQEQARLNYEIVQNKVKEGISSNSDLIDANYLLTRSRRNYFKAFYDEYLAIATLERIFER